MGFFKNEVAVLREVLPPSLDERLSQAADAADLAVSLFTRAADNLEFAAEAAVAVAEESAAKAAIHAKREATARSAAAKNRAQAEKIRNLLG
jgi:hypothetical protein